MAERRDLSFDDLDDVIAEVDRLLDGHETVGLWSLGQICNHLGTSLRLMQLGGRAPADAEAPPGTEALRARILQGGRYPEGIEAPLAVLVPRPGLDAREEAETLRKAIARFQSAPGPFPAHPYLGPLNKDEWTRFHCVHAAHHLGFAWPRPGSGSGSGSGSK